MSDLSCGVCSAASSPTQLYSVQQMKPQEKLQFPVPEKAQTPAIDTSRLLDMVV